MNFRRYKWAVLCFLLILVSQTVNAKDKVCIAEKCTLKQDTVFCYDLTIPEKSQIAGITIDIQYDSTQLKLTNNSVGKVLESTMSKMNCELEGKVILTAISTDPIIQKGSLLNLEFEVLNGEKENIDIVCSVKECIDQNCGDIPFTIDFQKVKNPLYDSDVEKEDKVENKEEQEQPDSVEGNRDTGQDKSDETIEVEEESEKANLEKDTFDYENENTKKTNDLTVKNMKSIKFIAIAMIIIVVLILSIWVVRRKQK